ncbi:MAG TPA: hypothetical protein VFM46_17465 [Pseudomonadales bacterium]|nr:hypothetical protein [Pseudomonadales bacterium]
MNSLLVAQQMVKISAHFLANSASVSYLPKPNTQSAPSQMRMTQQLRELISSLELNSSQREKISQLMQSASMDIHHLLSEIRQQKQLAMQGQTEQPDQPHARLASLHLYAAKQLYAILTSEQKEKLEQRILASLHQPAFAANF